MSKVGSVYAQALYGLAKEEGKEKLVLEQLKVLDTAFGNQKDFLRLLDAHNLPKQERCRILEDSFRGKVQPYLLNFMKLLTEKRCMRCFPDCCSAYRALYHQDNGILTVRAVTAAVLSESQAKKLTDKLVRITGRTIRLTNRVDEACLGGIRLDYDGKRVDDTVAHRLDCVGALLKNTVL